MGKWDGSEIVYIYYCPLSPLHAIHELFEFVQFVVHQKNPSINCRRRPCRHAAAAIPLSAVCADQRCRQR